MTIYNVVFRLSDGIDTRNSFEDNIYYSFAAEKTEEGICVKRNEGWSFNYHPDKPALEAKTKDKATLYEWTSLFKKGIYERKLVWTKGEEKIECIVTDVFFTKWINPFQDETIAHTLSDDSKAFLAFWRGCCSENECVMLHDWILKSK